MPATRNSISGTLSSNSSEQYEYIHLFHTGKKKSSSASATKSASVDHYVKMTSPKDKLRQQHSHDNLFEVASGENMDDNEPKMRSYNPNRKLRRMRNNYDSLGYENSGTNIDSDDNTPLSPSNYKQPPTPEHPPPSARHAERIILDRIRPLSQVGELDDELIAID